MAELKQIQITGGAAEDYTSVMKTGRKKRSTRKNRKEDMPSGVVKQGGATPAALIQLEADRAPTLPGTPPPKGIETTGLKVYPEGPAPVGGAAASAKPKAKVVLEPKKKEETKQLPKLKLEAPKKRHATSTRKARKIRVSLSNLNKRITRHKKIQKEAKVVPIEQIKKSLVEAKLIKQETKAPDNILRQIYADYQALKNKAL
jgi:hypothetical protein